MYKLVMHFIFVFFFSLGAYSSGHQEQIYAERIVGALSKGELVPDSYMDDLLNEAASITTSTRNSGSSQEGQGKDFGVCLSDLVEKAGRTFNDEAMCNLETVLQTLIQKGGANLDALTEATLVITDQF